MKTKRSLRSHEALLVGRLNLSPQMVLTIHVWCPYCKQYHGHGWPIEGPYSNQRVEHRGDHCFHVDGTPFSRGGYWIGLDPFHSKENRALYEKAMSAPHYRKGT